MTALSRELALVDPLLGAAARAALYESGCFVPAVRWPAAHPQTQAPSGGATVAATGHKAQQSASPRRLRRLALAGTAFAAPAALALVTALGLAGAKPQARSLPDSESLSRVQTTGHAQALHDARGARTYTWSATPTYAAQTDGRIVRPVLETTSNGCD